MASGTIRERYQTDAGNIFYARTDDDPGLSEVRGEPPTGSITENITFKVSKKSKEVGCVPRHCVLKPKSTVSISGCLVNPTGASKKVVVWKKDTIPPSGTEVTLGGRVWIVGSVIGEQMR